GAVRSLQDCIGRMYPRDLNRRAVESLITGGAMDGFGLYRAQMLMMYDRIASACAAEAKTVAEGQLGFFQDESFSSHEADITPPAIEEFSRFELLTMEKETTGLYLSGHPMMEYSAALKKAGAVDIGDILKDYASDNEEEGIITPKKYEDGQQLLIAGVIGAVKSKTTKSGSAMAYVTLEDVGGSMEILCFSRVLSESGVYVRTGTAVAVRGKLTVREGEKPKLIADALAPASQPPEEMRRFGSTTSFTEPTPPPADVPSAVPEEKLPRKIYLRITSANRQNLPRVECLLRFLSGTVPVIFFDEATGKYTPAPPELCADYSLALSSELITLLGQSNVVIK
ncbi:MAG: hypothetical protein MJ141_00510, partial [Clostridia bacterium]|nr:hypothetical protein [Clostridia bacterium]